MGGNGAAMEKKVLREGEREKTDTAAPQHLLPDTLSLMASVCMVREIQLHSPLYPIHIF